MFNRSILHMSIFNLRGDNVPKHIQGISCDAKNCVYHDGDNYCTASRIAVGPSYATSSSDTVCATFKEKKMK